MKEVRFSLFRRMNGACLLGSGLILASGVVCAQESGGSGVIVDPALQSSSSDVTQEQASQQDDKPKYSLIAGLSTGPRYMGSDETTTSPMLGFSVEYGPFFLDSMRGLGAQYSTSFGTHLTAALAYDGGRSDKKNEGGNYWSSGAKELEGMGRIKGSTTIKLDLSQDVTDWLAVNVGGEFAVAGQKHRGNQYTAGISLRPWMTETDQVEVGVTAHLGDKDYNQTYFGVTPEQALRSRYGQFDAESGIYASSVGVSWMHMIDEHWSTLAAGEYQQFSSKIKKSPIVRDNSSVTAVVGVNYTF